MKQNGNSVGSLSEEQKSLVTGCLLGDGYMRCKTNAHLQITHSYKQKDYVDWKYNKLKEFVLTPPKTYKGNGNRVGYRFFTRSLPVFTHFYRRFYSGKRKVIPKGLVINPLILAIWFMDDGSRSYRSCYFNTQYFNQANQEILKMFLFHSFGFKPNLDKDKQYRRIRLSVDDSRRMTEIIYPYVIPSLRYKLPI